MCILYGRSSYLGDTLLVDHQPEVAYRSLAERALSGDVRLAPSIKTGHVVSVDIALRVSCHLQLHAAVVVRQQMWKPVELDVGRQLGDTARKRGSGWQSAILVREGDGRPVVVDVGHSHV